MEQYLGKLQRLAEVQDKAKKNKNLIMDILASVHCDETALPAHELD